MEQQTEARLWRVREVVGSVGVALWASLHLWEQWSAFGGRDAFAARWHATSDGSGRVLVEAVLGVLPPLLWIGLTLGLRLRGRREPAALAGAMAEDPEAARRLGWIVRVASWVFFGWLLYHAAWLWLPKLAGGGDPFWTWLRLRELGAWPRAVPLALGLSASLFHAWGAFPRLLVALDLARTAPLRRAARLSGLILGLGFTLLYAQLAGWHAAGAGAVWPL